MKTAQRLFPFLLRHAVCFSSRCPTRLHEFVDKKVFWTCAAAAATSSIAPSRANPNKRSPNFVIPLADDLGYGDIGAFGSQVIATPELDRMASQGAKLTEFT
jgi:hypothetical protein